MERRVRPAPAIGLTAVQRVPSERPCRDAQTRLVRTLIHNTRCKLLRTGSVIAAR
jgi:hypothetical protein